MLSSWALRGSSPRSFNSFQIVSSCSSVPPPSQLWLRLGIRMQVSLFFCQDNSENLLNDLEQWAIWEPLIELLFPLNFLSFLSLNDLWKMDHLGGTRSSSSENWGINTSPLARVIGMKSSQGSPFLSTSSGSSWSPTSWQHSLADCSLFPNLQSHF